MQKQPRDRQSTFEIKVAHEKATAASNQMKLEREVMKHSAELEKVKASQSAAMEAASKQIAALNQANPSSSHQEPPLLQNFGRSSLVDGESSINSKTEGSIPSPNVVSFLML
jgi:hypothetical protein